jgi:hypothetical protein
MWQVQETKLKMINQLRTRKIGREVENAFEDLELSAGEMQAAATGNMDLLREIQIKGDIKKLEQRKRAFDAQKADLQNRKKSVAQKLATLPAKIADSKVMADGAKQYEKELAEQAAKFKATIDGKEYTDVKMAGDTLRASVDAHVYMQRQEDGKFGGKQLTEAEVAQEPKQDAKSADYNPWTKRPVPLSVDLNGTVYTSREKLAEAFSTIRGDKDPISWKFDGKTFNRSTVAALAIEQAIKESIAEQDVRQVGSIGPFKVSVEGQPENKFNHQYVEVVLSHAGKTVSGVVHNDGAANIPARVIRLAEGLVSSASYQFDHENRQLATAKKDQSELAAAQEQGEWPDQGKLEELRAKHKEVLQRLSGAGVKATLDGETLHGAMGESNQAGNEADVVFSRGAQSQATSSVEATVNTLKANWKNAPKIVVAFDLQDPRIPERVRQEDLKQRSGGARGTPEGFYYGGTVYLMSSQLKDPADIQRVLFHETLGHFGLRGTFGDSLKPLLQQIATFRKAEVRAKAIEYGLRGVDNLDMLTAAEEVLAEMAQKRPEIGFVKRAIALIRTWLRENGFKSLKLTDDEIITQMILPARAFVEQGGKPDNEDGIAFSRGTNDAMTNKDVVGNSQANPADDSIHDYPKAGMEVDGLRVRDEIPNTDSIAATFENYKVLPGVREVPFSDFSGPDAPTARTRKLAEAIEESGEISPLIVAIDKGGPYILEGAHRYDALQMLGKTSFPAMVVIDKPNEPTAPDSGGAPAFSRSIGDTLKGVTVTDIKARTGNKLADYRGLGLQFLGGRQIVDLYAKDLPQLNGYTQMVQQMSADANEVGAQADTIANGWAKLNDERQLAELMHDATLAQIDPAKDYVTGDNRLQWGALNAKFKALSDDAKKVYTQARDAYEEHYAQVREAIRDKIERSEMSSASKAAMLERMDGEFFDKIKGVYFPLARFGKYVVVTRGPGGNVVNVSRAETLNEAEATRDLMRKTYPTEEGFAVGKVLKDKEFNAARDSVSRGFLKDLFGVLDEKGMGEELQDAVNQLYLASMPDLSWAKHGIHRKGTPGFSQDARRAFAQNMFHGARYLAKLRYADQLQDKLTGMQNFVEAKAGDEAFDSVKAQQVVDELNKRHDSLMNPKSNPLSTALTSFGFVFHMGLSPASAMVNLSGTAMVAYPIMGAKWGFDKAAGALMTAAKQAATNKNNIGAVLQGDERRAYDAAVKAGTIDVTAAHDLAGIAQGEDAGVMWRMRPVMKWASFMFHHAERFNRQVTFVAAYRLARDTGAAHEVAFEQATKATYDGHFDYASSNRPRVMQGNAAKVLLLFKQYGQNMIYTIARQAQLAMKAEKPKDRKEARKALGGLLVMHAAGAGVLGLPLVGTLLAAASMLGGSDDEPWDAEVALRNMLADTFGQKPAEVMARGFSRLTPFDISGRIGLNHLVLPDIQEGLEGQRLGESAMAAALGPVAGIGINLLKGMQEISDGHMARGIETMMPAALRGLIKALRYEQEGAKDKTGVVIQDEVSAAGIAGQALGFAPSDVCAGG